VEEVETDIDLVLGLDVAIVDLDLEYVGDIEYVIDGVCDFVNGRVVTIPEVERVLVTDCV